MSRPIVPAPGFNTRPLARPPGICCGCFSRDTKRTALGTYYCTACLASAKAYAAKVRGEGHEAVRAAVVP